MLYLTQDSLFLEHGSSPSLLLDNHGLHMDVWLQGWEHKRGLITIQQNMCPLLHASLNTKILKYVYLEL